jgi:hypothetical protein
VAESSRSGRCLQQRKPKPRTGANRDGGKGHGYGKARAVVPAAYGKAEMPATNTAAKTPSEGVPVTRQAIIAVELQPSMAAFNAPGAAIRMYCAPLKLTHGWPPACAALYCGWLEQGPMRPVRVIPLQRRWTIFGRPS